MRPLGAASGLCVALAGCAPTLPTYPPMSTEASLGVIAARAESVRSIAARCDITLALSGGDSVILDGVLAAEPPDRWRIRAWKFGHAVFDLTATPEGVWLLAADEMSESAESLASASQAGIDELMAMLGPGFFQLPPANAEIVGDRLRVTMTREGGRSVACEIERATLTPRLFVVTGDDAAARTLRLERYRMVAGIPWPTRLRLAGPEGTITLMLTDIELNEAPAPAAFVPPGKAIRLP